jgi:hypothetical protein
LAPSTLGVNMMFPSTRLPQSTHFHDTCRARGGETSSSALARRAPGSGSAVWPARGRLGAS